MTRSSTGPIVEPLPEPSREAKRILSRQIFVWILAGLFQVVRFPVFLFNRHKIKQQMAKVIQNPGSDSS